MSLILLVAVTLLAQTAQAESTNNETSFSVVQISDTQHLSSKHPTLWPHLVSWIIAHNSTYNIKMVVLTGDIVDHGENLTQWMIANESMGQLLNANMPYTWDAGNHDQIPNNWVYSGNANGSWYGSGFSAFNATALRQKPYWVSDINDGKNTAVKFTCGNYSVLIINLEFHANQTAIDWMINLLDSHPNSHIIVATHSYLNGLLGYGFFASPDTPEWELNLKSILDRYPNVFLTVSGHYIHTLHPAGDEETSSYIRKNMRQETFFNRQMALGDGGVGGDSVRIFTFNVTDPKNASIQASTYDIYSGVWKTDLWNQFSFQEYEKNQIKSPLYWQTDDIICNVALAPSKVDQDVLSSMKSPEKTPTPTPTLMPTVASTQTNPPQVSNQPETATTNSKMPVDVIVVCALVLAAICAVLGLKLKRKK